MTRPTSAAWRKPSPATAAASSDWTAFLWDTESGKEVQRIEAPDVVSCVAFSADGAHAIFSCNDRALRLWELRK